MPASVWFSAPTVAQQLGSVLSYNQIVSYVACRLCSRNPRKLSTKRLQSGRSLVGGQCVRELSSKSRIVEFLRRTQIC